MHHEERLFEKFVGNTTRGKVGHLIEHLKTARVGLQAYDIEGNQLPSPEYLPVFVGSADLPEYDRIMMKKLSEIRKN